MAWGEAPSGSKAPMVLPQGGGSVEVKARRRLKEEGMFDALVSEMETKLAELGQGMTGVGGTGTVSDLDLSQNHVTPEQLERVLSIVTSSNVVVRRFRLFGIPTFNDEAMRILGDHLRTLTREQAPTEMHLSDCAITSEGFYHLMSAIEESDLYPGAPPGGKARPLYLRLENNYIAEESLKEKQDAGVLRAFKKSMGQRDVTMSSPVKVDLIVHENGGFKQKTGEPPAPENAPAPRMVNDRWDEKQRAQASAAAWQKPLQQPQQQQWGGWGGWSGGQQAWQANDQKWPAAQQAAPAAAWQAPRPAGFQAPGAVRPPPGAAAARPATPGIVRPMMVSPHAVRPAAARPAASFVPPVTAARPAAAAWGAARPAWAGPAAAVRPAAAADRSRTPAARVGAAAPTAPAGPPPKPAQPPLPHPWEEHYSEEYNIPYFWNSETGDSAWERPT